MTNAEVDTPLYDKNSPEIKYTYNKRNGYEENKIQDYFDEASINFP